MNMDQASIEKLKSRLIEERDLLEEELSSFSHKDPTLKGNWETDFPSYGDSRAEQDENADEVEEYTNDLPIEYSLETKLQHVNEALEKIDNGAYGICEICEKPIEKERLEAEPSAKTHVDCK